MVVCTSLPAYYIISMYTYKPGDGPRNDSGLAVPNKSNCKIRKDPYPVDGPVKPENDHMRIQDCRDKKLNMNILESVPTPQWNESSDF